MTLPLIRMFASHLNLCHLMSSEVLIAQAVASHALLLFFRQCLYCYHSCSSSPGPVRKGMAQVLNENIRELNPTQIYNLLQEGIYTKDSSKQLLAKLHEIIWSSTYIYLGLHSYA